ncbi:hypothetical protein RFI_37174 [Reticulomyxa filosa]|uniref:Uncharacterized protein n=1 Tax=Reticulomyxa filosa TaxID=46433 RepID=X6LE42_RETFI|nr:hypothetical protein RFI_37174 [Reticulomyxa filosa]|eukprot:ETO00273.1 hypothetical protein RFI_37174 [Reticulomyxa filosa]
MEKDATESIDEEILRQHQIGYYQSQKTINCEDDNEKKEQASFLEFVDGCDNYFACISTLSSLEKLDFAFYLFTFNLRKADCQKEFVLDLERCFICITNMKIYGFCLVNIIFAKIAVYVKDKKIKKEKYVMHFRKVIESMCMEKVYEKDKNFKYQKC